MISEDGAFIVAQNSTNYAAFDPHADHAAIPEPIR